MTEIRNQDNDTSFIVYAQEPELDVDEFLDLLHRSTLAARRPVHRTDILQAMLNNADLLCTARVGQMLVGMARALTDFAYCTYLSDLAVDVAWQNRGIGRELLERTHTAAGRQTNLILLAAPQAVTYYPHIGLLPHPSCWIQPGIPNPAAPEIV